MGTISTVLLYREDRKLDIIKNIFLGSLQCAHEETGLGERKIKLRGKVLENGLIQGMWGERGVKEGRLEINGSRKKKTVNRVLQNYRYLSLI